MLIFHGFLTPEDNWKLAVESVEEANKYGPNLTETLIHFAGLQKDAAILRMIPGYE